MSNILNIIKQLQIRIDAFIILNMKIIISSSLISIIIITVRYLLFFPDTTIEKIANLKFGFLMFVIGMAFSLSLLLKYKYNVKVNPNENFFIITGIIILWIIAIFTLLGMVLHPDIIVPMYFLVGVIIGSYYLKIRYTGLSKQKQPKLR